MAKNTGGKPLSAKDEKFREFWQPLVDTLRKEHRFPNVPDAHAPPDAELRIKTGLPGVRYVLVFAQIKEFSVDLYIDGSKKELNKQLFDQLKRQRKESIESELDKTLEWMPLPHGNASRIRLYSGWRCRIDDHPENLREVRKWMIWQLVAFNRVFGPMFDRLAE